MATNEISNETLLTNEISNETLDEMFNRGLNIHDDLEICEDCQNSETFQHKVKKGILILEDATRLVSVLDIFSRNETVSEVPTEHLKFFLLPMLLGELNSYKKLKKNKLVLKVIFLLYNQSTYLLIQFQIN